MTRTPRPSPTTDPQPHTGSPRRQALAGSAVHAASALGFRFEDGRLVEDPEERATLDRVRDMKRRGISTGRMVTILNAEGLHCRGARLERVRVALSKRAGGVDLVTSHVVREVIERGLNSVERDLSRK